VHHRPRRAGVSKYGIGNRALRGLVDCLVMRWFARRLPRARRLLDEAPSGAPAAPKDPAHRAPAGSARR